MKKIFTSVIVSKTELGSNVDVTVRQRTEVFNQNNNVVRWNAYVSKKLMKQSQLEVRATIFDILNQNRGYTRESVNGIITENRYNTVQRYAMLNVIWNFTYNPAGGEVAK